jgi:hypothetical protein
MKLPLALTLLLAATSFAAKDNPTADDFIRRIDERTAMVKQKMQERGGGQKAEKGKGRGGRGGQGHKRGGKIGERLNMRDERIEQRLASSNLSEEEKQRVRAKMQSSRKELEALAEQHRQQHQGKQGGRRKQPRQ